MNKLSISDGLPENILHPSGLRREASEVLRSLDAFKFRLQRFETLSAHCWWSIYPSTRLGTVPWLEIDIGRLGGAFPWIPGQELVACFQPGSQSDGFQRLGHIMGFKSKKMKLVHLFITSLIRSIKTWVMSLFAPRQFPIVDTLCVVLRDDLVDALTKLARGLKAQTSPE
uniref:Uncharacterized protein n=1 Tax=Caenorhabditis japonica TaxID=281687 RepID=A0A8R1EQP7_CAEJA